MTTISDNCLKKNRGRWPPIRFGRRTGYRRLSCKLNHFLRFYRDFVVSMSIMQMKRFPGPFYRRVTKGRAAAATVGQPGTVTWPAGFPRFPAKRSPAIYRCRKEPRRSGCSGKAREMACSVIRDRNAVADGRSCAATFCGPREIRSGTDLRVSCTVATNGERSERHAAGRFMGPYHGAASKRLFAVKRKRLIKTSLHNRVNIGSMLSGPGKFIDPLKTISYRRDDR